jgi:hypothetical protein
MRKFIELGHLRPTDLVWRHGFTDWRPGSAVFPEIGDAASAPSAHANGPRAATPTWSRQPAQAARPQQASRTGAGQVVPDRGAGSKEPRARRHWGTRIGFILMLLALISGAGWFGWENRNKLPEITSVLTSVAVKVPGDAAGQYRISPFAASGNTAQSIDAALQKTALWRVLKRDFSDWYAERVKEVERLRSEKQDDTAVQKKLAEAIVALRRKHAAQALAAAPKYLRRIAVSFQDNLLQMAKAGAEPCFGLISYGEQSTQVLETLKDPARSEPLHRQVTAIFEAVEDGRKTPQTYQPAAKADYDVLVDQLKSRGWGQTELQTFSDQRALARAPHDQVCKLVQDWIGAHLSLTDSDLQARLLSETLRPLVQG